VGENVLPLGKLLKAHGEKAAPIGVGPAAPVGNDLWRGVNGWGGDTQDEEGGLSPGL
jgi:hypothetical protein